MPSDTFALGLSKLFTAAIVATAIGCVGEASEEPSGSGDRPEPKPPKSIPQVPADFNYTTAVWEVTNASNSEGTISHDPQIAFVGPTEMMTFSEPKPRDFGDQDIFRAVRTAAEWTATSLTLSASEQLAFPNLVRSGNSLWYSWTGRADPEAPLSIWLRREPIGSPPEAELNATPDLFDPMNPEDPELPFPRQNYEGQLVEQPNGGVMLIYQSDVRVGIASPVAYRIEALMISPTGEFGTAEVVHAQDSGSCGSLRAAADASGRVHIVARCSGDAPLVHIEGTSGNWQTSAVDLGDSRAPTAVDIAVDSGSRVHLVWAGSIDCDGETCRRVFYSRSNGVPVIVADDRGFMPVIGTDQHDRPLVAFHRTGDFRDVVISYSDDGRTFAPLTPLATSSDRDTSANQIRFDDDGYPHILFERIVSGTDPLNGESMHARLAPLAEADAR